MSEKEEEDADVDRVIKACQELSEYFDTVQCFCTRHESTQGGTISAKYGLGNWFARYGQVKLWVVKEDEGARMEIREQE